MAHDRHGGGKDPARRYLLERDRQPTGSVNGIANPAAAWQVHARRRRPTSGSRVTYDARHSAERRSAPVIAFVSSDLIVLTDSMVWRVMAPDCLTRRGNGGG